MSPQRPARALCRSPRKSPMRGSTNRVPWCRELFLSFGILCCNPIKWKGERFVASGAGFLTCTVLVYAGLASNLLGAYTSLWIFSAAFKPFELESLIEGELRAFVHVMNTAFRITNPLLVASLIHRRAKIASTFNLLNQLWVR